MWRLKSGQSLQRHEFPDGEESVLYNALSGDTHLLGAAAIELLLCLQCGPADDAMLRDFLAAAMDGERDPDFDAQVAALLDQLSSFYLIESFSC